MNKEKLIKMINAKETKKKELQERSKVSEEVAELRSINTELEGINEDIRELRSMLNELEEEERSTNPSQRTDAVNNGEVVNEIEKLEARSYTPGKGFKVIESTGTASEKRGIITEEEMEKRGEIWKGHIPEERAVVIDSTIIVPHYQSNEVKALPWNEISSIIDLVNVVPLENGESYDVPFEYEVGEGDYTAEPSEDATGGEAHTAETKFDKSKIRKAYITAYAEVSKQLMKSPSANYAERVQSNVEKAVRKKIAKEILVGNGGDNQLQGIFTQPAELTNDDGSTKRPNRVIDKDIEITTLTGDTISDIVLKYGGDNDVEGGQCLIMNKLTLNELNKLRDSNGNRMYDIKIYGNSFTIDGIGGVFSAHVAAWATATTGQYVMAYGNPKAYELTLYGGCEVEQSTEFKFKQGMTSFKADQFVGGNLAAYKSFIRVKKKVA